MEEPLGIIVRDERGKKLVVSSIINNSAVATFGLGEKGTVYSNIECLTATDERAFDIPEPRWFYHVDPWDWRTAYANLSTCYARYHFSGMFGLNCLSNMECALLEKIERGALNACRRESSSLKIISSRLKKFEKHFLNQMGLSS